MRMRTIIKRSTSFLKPYMENQNHEDLLISTDMCKEAGYKGTCNSNSITEQLCDNDFINCDGMKETEDKIDECREEQQQDAALNSTVNTPETTNSKTTETFKIDKTSTNVPNAKKNLKKHETGKHKTENL